MKTTITNKSHLHGLTKEAIIMLIEKVYKMKQWLEKFKTWLKEGNPNNKAPQYLSGKKNE